MSDKSQRPKGRDGALSALNIAIDGLNLAREGSSIAPASVAFGCASDLLTLIRDSTIKEADYVGLGLECADVCEALNRGMNGRRADQLSRSILKAIEQLTMIMTEIQRHNIKRGKRSVISRSLRAKGDKEVIAAWRLDLNRILHVFDAELVANTHLTTSVAHHDVVNIHSTVSDVRRDIPNVEASVLSVRRDVPTIVSEARSDTTNARTIVSDNHPNKRKDADGQNQTTHASAPGESSPPLPTNPHGTTLNVRRDISEVHRDVVNTQTAVHDIRNMLKIQEGASVQTQLTQNGVPGESSPPPPRVFFGRDELIEKVVGLAEQLIPVALIGPGGIGKTSIVLAVLHDDRIKHRFSEDRRFIRCDEFPASPAHFLRKLSKVIGAGVENPEELAPLRPFLSSKRMLIVFDNAESILDPQGMSAQELYAIVDELTRFGNLCICITSRISAIPPGCETLEIPTLSIEAASNTFYRIYKHGEQSDPISGILEQLDFHPLSVTLLATVAQHNKWDPSRLTREWERRRTGVLRAKHSRSLAATIELSLTSPMFRELGPDARGFLEVVAFLPQGVDENKIDWLFPTISNATDIFDEFCILSLTYRANGFITMLAPLRDHLRPKDPRSSLLLGTTKEHYFTRLSTQIYPGKPGFEESRWVTSEDLNVEHMLDVFTSIGENPEDAWNACANFMNYLFWHKRRLVMLGPKIDALPDDHPSKARCLYDLSWLLYSVGNYAEQKRVLAHASKFWRERGDNRQVAQTLRSLSEANRLTYLRKEAIQQAKEASEILERLGDTADQAECLISLAWALRDDSQFDAAEEAASRAINLLPGKGEEYRVCQGQRVLGITYDSKGETEKATHHFEVALGIASSFNWHAQLFWIRFCLARLFSGRDRLEDAHTHIKHAKSHAVDNQYLLARASWLHATIWDKQHRPEEAKTEVLRALEVFEKLGATIDVEGARNLLRRIDARRN